MRLLLDSVAVVAAATEPAELARRFTRAALRDAARAPRRRPGTGPPGRARAAGRAGAGDGRRAAAAGDRGRPRDRRARLPRARLRGRGRARRPTSPALCALPLFLQDRCLGGILIEVASAHVSFEGSDRRLLDALASEMAVALDRARLMERERERQREEKERLEAEVTDLRRVVHGSRLAYRSAAMESLLGTVRKVARTDTTVLITGESGTGKEMLAHTLHELSNRHERSDRGGGLQRDLADADRERAVRAREGRVHRRPSPASPAAWPRRTGPPCSSTRSATCRSTSRASSCASCRRSSSRRWAA